ncbi:MAG: hypothetical protein JRI32_08045 [Deltaproteobacteria bacterium]|nr:hypothetical protein [Deltaproteobacteria bacterium]
MKKKILTICLLLVLTTAFSVLAEEQPAASSAEQTPEMSMEKMDSSIMKMKEMRKKMEEEKNPAKQKELMHQHMQQMKDCMGMMHGYGMMMRGKEGMMDGKDMSKMPMSDRMMRLEKMMGHCPMMRHRGMMKGHKMSGTMCSPMFMMEKRMEMMQEMINGIMAQQKIMMK